MSLIGATLPAERARGCVWASRFGSASEVLEDGGSIVGAPTFDPGQGVEFDGTSDYISFQTVPHKLADLTLLLEFTPTLALASYSSVVLFQTGDGAVLSSRYLITVGGDLDVDVNGTNVATIPAATLAAAWNEQSRNVIVLAATSGDTDVWLNGTQILAADATVYSADDVDRFGWGGVAPQMAVHRAMVFDQKLTDAEALAYSNGNTFRYGDDRRVWCLMDMEHHDPVAGKALDICGNDITLGSGGAGIPTKLPGNGYEFDGVDDQFSDLPTLNTGESCISVLDGILHIEPEVSNVLTWLGTAGQFAGRVDLLGVMPTPSYLQQLDLVLRNRHVSNISATGVDHNLLFTDQSAAFNQVSISIRSPSGSLRLHWGDGSSEDVICDDVLRDYTHDYWRHGYYSIGISGNIDQIADFRCYDQSHIYGDISALAALTSLTYLRFDNTSVSGDISALSSLTLLKYLYLYSTSVSGDISALSSLTLLTSLRLYDTSVSGDISALSSLTSLTYLYLYNTSVSGAISALSSLTSLTSLRLYDTSVSGDISALSSLTSLTTLWLCDTSVSGDIRAMSLLTSLSYLYLNDTNVDTYTSGALPAWPGCNIQLDNLGLDSTEVDNFIIDLENGAGAGGTLDLSGNANRTHASDAAYNSLTDPLGLNWSVTVGGP